MAKLQMKNRKYRSVSRKRVLVSTEKKQSVCTRWGWFPTFSHNTCLTVSVYWALTMCYELCSCFPCILSFDSYSSAIGWEAHIILTCRQVNGGPGRLRKLPKVNGRLGVKGWVPGIPALNTYLISPLIPLLATSYKELTHFPIELMFFSLFPSFRHSFIQ